MVMKEYSLAAIGRRTSLDVLIEKIALEDLLQLHDDFCTTDGRD